MLPPSRFVRLVPVALLFLFSLSYLEVFRPRETPELPHSGVVNSQQAPEVPSTSPLTESSVEPPQTSQIPSGTSPALEAASQPPNTENTTTPKERVTPSQCAPEIQQLRDLGLSDEIIYTRRCVKPVNSQEDPRNSVTNVQQPLIEGGVLVDLDLCVYEALPACEPIELHVPHPHPQGKYPHLLFGISTIYSRLAESLPAFAQWLSGSDSKMVAIVVDAEQEGQDPKDFKAAEDMYLKAGIRLQCVKPRRPLLTVDRNHFTMIEDMVAAMTTETRWLGLLDDDTFFPSLYNLDQELAKYDHKKSAWLGALSEDLGAIRNWGIMAFGGAGVFLSVPLAQELVPRLDDCLGNAEHGTGDGILRDCVFAETHSKLTTVNGLYQHDIRGDVAGFYESGIRPLSLHHWKSWYHEPVDKMARIVEVCGDCFLQRWQFGDDTLLSNGYSIVQYPEVEYALDSLDLDRMEATWISPQHNFDWSLGPLRPRLPDGAKKTYKLAESIRAGQREIRQFYVYKGDSKLMDKSEVVELVWQR